MGVEDQAPSAAEVAEAGVSEAQIAVHWREEEYFEPPADVRRAGERERPGDPRAVQRGALPGLLHRVRGDADVGSRSGTRFSTRAIRRSGSGGSAGA